MSLLTEVSTLEVAVRRHLDRVRFPEEGAPPMALEARYAAAWAAKKAMEDVIKLLDAEIGGLNEALQEQFLLNDQQSARVAGVTVYLERQLWAGKAEGVKGGELAATLEELELEEFLTVNASTISSYVRELARAATGEDHPSADAALQALPAPLQRVLKVDERINIRGRRTA